MPPELQTYWKFKTLGKQKILSKLDGNKAQFPVTLGEIILWQRRSKCTEDWYSTFLIMFYSCRRKHPVTGFTEFVPNDLSKIVGEKKLLIITRPCQFFKLPFIEILYDFRVFLQCLIKVQRKLFASNVQI